MRNRLISVVAAVAASLGPASVAATASAASVAATSNAATSNAATGERASPSEIRMWARPFSPNGDGVRDTTDIELSLPGYMDAVTLQIARHDAPSQPFRQVDLGRLGPGMHTWTWDGRRDDGTQVDNGTYLLAIAPTGAGWGGTAGAVVVDRTFSPGVAPAPEFDPRPGKGLAVFPRTRVIRDHVTLEDSGVREYPANPALGMENLRLEIRDPDGRLVLRRPMVQKSEAEPWFSYDWTARVGGKPLAPGRYRAVVNGRDHAGNRGPSAPLILWVSRERLEWVERSISVVPAGSEVDACFFDGHAGCGDVGGTTCGDVVPSRRFSGGLSYRAGDCDPSRADGYSVAWATHWLPLPDAVVGRGVSRARVAFTGAPTHRGETDEGALTIHAEDYVDDVTVHSSTGARTAYVVPRYWNGVSENTSSSAEGLPPGVAWSFSTSAGDAVDVERFVVRARYLAVAD